MKIWKYPLSVTSLQKIQMPDGAKVLTVQTQGDEPHLWAMVDESAPLVTRLFATFGTGETLPDGDAGAYVGTYQASNGLLVFHVFEW